MLTEDSLEELRKEFNARYPNNTIQLENLKFRATLVLISALLDIKDQLIKFKKE